MGPNRIRGITVHRPWGYAIAALGKDFENRSWRCNLPVGSYLAIHSGQAWDKQGCEFICRINQDEFLPDPSPEIDPPQMIRAIAVFDGNFTALPDGCESPWFVGPVGWRLKDVVEIDPVPCRGQQGLWILPEPILNQVRVNFQKAIEGRI